MWSGSDSDQAITRELRFAAIELGDSPVLGQDLRLDLGPGTTVLVGKNGAGKSAILERIFAAVRHVLGAVEGQQPDPGRFACEIVTPEQSVRYECWWNARAPGAGESHLPESVAPIIKESCNVLAPSAQQLWRAHEGVMVRSDGSTMAGSPDRTLLFYVLTHRRSFATMSYPLCNVFSSVRSIPPGSAHGHGNRTELIVPTHGTDRSRRPPGRLERLLHRLKDWQEASHEQFAELLAIGQRIELFKDLNVKIYRDPEPTSKTSKDLVSAEVDGVDLGLLSDGTVRALELLCALIEPEIKLVLIEEPESAVHPGLLAKLLHEIDAYSADRQILLSTHSPQVVSWSKPDALRIVERKAGVTHVERLGDRALERLGRYLHDEDTLGQFIYGGGLDVLRE